MKRRKGLGEKNQEKNRIYYHHVLRNNSCARVVEIPLENFRTFMHTKYTEEKDSTLILVQNI